MPKESQFKLKVANNNKTIHQHQKNQAQSRPIKL